MIKLKDGYAKLIGTTATGSANNVLLSNGGDKITGNASGNIPLNNGTLNVNLNAEKINGYTSALLWRSNGATWNPTTNITMTPTANNLEWSFDFRNKSGFTGSYWHVWDESKNTLLRVEADSGKVKAPYGFVGNLEGVATTANTANKLSVSAGSLTEPVYFNDGVPVKCTYINAKRKYEVDLSTLSSTNFYPVIFDKSYLETDCEIHSPNLTGTAPYNLNSIHFLYQSLGWADTPKRFLVLHYGTYSNTEITIGAIGGGTNEGEQCVWLRGGLLYRFYSNKEPLLKTSNFSSGDQLFTVGTNYYGGENVKVTIVWKALETTQWVATLDYADKIYVALNVSTNGNYPLVWSVENNTESKRSLLLRKSYLDLLYNPATKQITSTGSLSIPTISNNGGVLTLKTTTENHIYLRYNNDDNNSIVLTSGHLGPTLASRGKLTLGTLSNNWKGVYSLLGYFTGNVFICNPDGGNSPRLIFQRGTTTDGAYDWDLINEAGTLKIRSNTNTGTFKSALELSRLNLTLTSNFNVLSLGYISSFKELDANDKHFNYALAYREIPGFNVGGMVVITLPNTWTNSMNLYEIDIYDYAGGTKLDDDALHSKLTIGVYNYTETHYYNYGYTQLGSFNRKVRLAHDGTHCCILLGEPTSTWNFTLIFLSRVLSGRSAHSTWSSGYEINLVTSETAYTKITELHRTRLRFDDVVADNFRGNLIGNADTASKWTTARTLTVGNSAKTVDGSADVTWDLESILKNPTIIGTTSSWDITVPGVYGVTSVNKFSGTNNPEHHAASGEVYRYGLLIVSRSGHGLALFYISRRDSDVSKYGIKYRTGYNSTYVSEWARLLDTLNYEKYVVKLDGHSLLWNNLYYTYKEVTMDTPDTVWYVKIVLSAYAQPNLIMINTGYNNRVDRAFLQFTGQFMGYFYRNNCQNQGNLTGLCSKTGYDSVEKKWIFWLRFRPISSTAAEGPATSATCKVYLGQSNNAFDISATTTAPEGVTWETVGTAYTSLLLRYATIRGNLIGNSDSATKAYLTYNYTSTGEYPIIWSNSNNTTSLNGSLFKSYSDLTYSPSNKRLTVKGLVTSPLFFHNLTSASSNPVIYIGSNNLNTTLLRVYSSDAADTSTFTGRYGYSLKYLGSDSNNRLVLFADNNGNTTQQVALAFTNAGNVGIRDYANSDFSLHVSGKTNIQTSNFGALWIRRLSSNLGATIGFHNTLGTLGYLGMKDVNGGILRWSADTNSIYKVWDEANDGPGSGLDADLLDGTHKSDLLSSITSTHTTNLSVTIGGTTKDVTKLWSSMLSIKDIRGTNVNPSDSSIQPNAITAWFNNIGTPTATCYSGFSVKGWGNNYGVWLLCSYSSDSGTPTGSLYFRQGEDDTWKNWRTILDDSNTSVSGGGSTWGDSITVSINGISTTLTIPNLPADVNVTLTDTTTSANYRVLLSRNANDTTETASSRKSAKLYFNPSTGVLTTTKVSANLDGDIVKKTPLLCAATESDNINIVENSNGAITNNYISNLTAIRKAIQFRWYNTYWQIGNIRGASSGTNGFGITYGSNTLCFRVTEAASYVYGSMYAVHFYESSDKRLKTNIQEILNSDKMPTIKEFDWKEDGSHSYGLIAQELEEQGYSELVSIKDNGYKTVNYSAALSLIVGKLQAKIKELEKEIENLKNKN